MFRGVLKHKMSILIQMGGLEVQWCSEAIKANNILLQM
ncbi:hypothetical protein SLEP1_g17507 [Rubroshorea leprosula]|uniref:Uncharacterized protein n=1 Tax=Rubroshorea leprosula TaxID=152421 RepID=A0AAV5J3E0_9ROSI|nr:hypothetical protein SLEP1_g17507 [Rubroshorea leprosula]